MDSKQHDLDEWQSNNGGISRYQLILLLVSGYFSFSTGLIPQIAIFLSAVPNHRCAVPPLDNGSYGLAEEEILNLTIPYDTSKQTYSSCYRYDINLTDCTSDLSCIVPTEKVIACDNGYYYDKSVYIESAISQWDLVCENDILDTIATSLFFFGFFIGSALYGPISDWFGRKLALFLFFTSSIAFSLAVAFANSFELYVFLRVMSGAATLGSYIAIYTYSMEISTVQFRPLVVFGAALTSSLGHLVLPLLALALKGDWRPLEIVSSLFAVPFVVVYFFIPESPRWLLTKGRHDEARKVVGRYAISNKTELTDKDWNEIVKSEEEKIAEEANKKYSFVVLYKRPFMRWVTFAVMYGWFAVSLVFYGLALNVGALAGDPYVNAIINGAMDVAAAFIQLVVPWTGRRVLLIASFFIASTGCLISTVCNELAFENTAIINAGVGLAIFGKMGAAGAFGSIYGVTSDVYPTVVRGTGLSVGSMSARIGGMASPFMLDLQESIPWLTQTIFGILAFFAFLTSFIFPETEKQDYLTSLDEAEHFYEKNMTFLRKFYKPSKTDAEYSTYSNKVDVQTEIPVTRL